MTTEIENEIDEAERQWASVQVAIPEELPENNLVVRAQRVFEAQILPLDVVRKRRAELGVENAALCTREQRQALITVKGLWRKINGQVDKVSDFLKEGALQVQRTVNGLKKQVKDEVARELQPILDKLAEWDEEDAELERQRLEAVWAADRAVEEAERARVEAEHRAETERLAEENRALVIQRETERLEKERLQEELAKLRAAQKIDDDRKQADLAAAQERARLETIEPDLPKLQRFAAALDLTRASVPAMQSLEAQELSTWACQHLERISAALLDFPTNHN